jgi:hypothetical protein
MLLNFRLHQTRACVANVFGMISALQWLLLAFNLRRAFNQFAFQFCTRCLQELSVSVYLSFYSELKTERSNCRFLPRKVNPWISDHLI